MSRRTHPCHTCENRTRHDDRVCANCRRRGVAARDGEVVVPVDFTFVGAPLAKKRGLRLVPDSSP